jgi:ATP-dependent DNA helicase RecQ
MGARSVDNAVFKERALRQEQEDVIRAIVSGENVIAVLMVSASLCHYVGTMSGFTLVVSPLLALCEDQILFMRANDVPVVRLDSM